MDHDLLWSMVAAYLLAACLGFWCGDAIRAWLAGCLRGKEKSAGK